MLLVRVTVVASKPPGAMQAELLWDAVWAHIGRDDRVEHITSLASAQEIELFIFLSQVFSDYESFVRSMTVRAFSNFPWIRSWETTGVALEGFAQI
ncbi:MAG TPA: hypothetical protein VGM10_16850 [Actinocrinis sp.]|jgi:hypothetical protein